MEILVHRAFCLYHSCPNFAAETCLLGHCLLEIPESLLKIGRPGLTVRCTEGSQWFSWGLPRGTGQTLPQRVTQ